MKLEKIITLANTKVQVRFNALERSLRATGCKLPLWVIPYDDNRFELPENALWWEEPEIISWLKKHNAHKMMRKYQCLTTGNYQYVDSDVIFLLDPSEVLESVDGFVASCGHWNNPGHTYTSESLRVLKKKSTLWQKSVFNAGQFACDKPLYSIEELRAKAESQDFKYSCLSFPYHDQPGLNLLVNTAPVTVRNLTLPPYEMESTWAGDYGNDDFELHWKTHNKPYLLHWAGCRMDVNRPIDNLFYGFLTQEERQKWDKELLETVRKEKSSINYLKNYYRKFKKTLTSFVE